MAKTNLNDPNRRRGETRHRKAALEDLNQISRVLYRHKWASLEDWVRSLDELADLTDDEIDEVKRLSRAEPDKIYFD
jgi:hypothetical protein